MLVFTTPVITTTSQRQLGIYKSYIQFYTKDKLYLRMAPIGKEVLALFLLCGALFYTEATIGAAHCKMADFPVQQNFDEVRVSSNLTSPHIVLNKFISIFSANQSLNAFRLGLAVANSLKIREVLQCTDL